MPIAIGAKPESGFTDPIGLLTDCHRRIERFLSILLQVSRAAHGEALNKEQRSAFETALGNMRELAEMAAKSQRDAFEVIRKRVEENMNALRGKKSDDGQKQ